MGGRAAEKLIFHELSTGASNDLENATKMARRMVTQYGMSKKVGSVSFSEGREVFLGRDFGRERNFSERTAETIDGEVRRLVEEAEKRAMSLLTKNRKLLEKLAKILLEKEMVEGYELDQLLGLKTPAPKPKPAPKGDQGKGPTPSASAPIVIPPLANPRPA
jgi:cell division protease FtsH